MDRSKAPSLAILVADHMAKGKGKKPEAEDKEDSGDMDKLVTLMDNFRLAVRQNDSQGMAEAFKAAHEVCSGYEEAEEQEGDEGEPEGE